MRISCARSTTTPVILAILCVVFLLQQFWLGVLVEQIDQKSAFARQQPSNHDDDITQDNNPVTVPSVPSSNKYLIYYLPPHPGQGTGNIISGILAAHLLGDEFDRIVCHQGYEESFDKAFEWKDAQHAIQCVEILQVAPHPSTNNTIVQNNFDESAIQSECAMKELLASDAAILYYKGNTYPRWPSHTRQINLFDTIFNPSEALHKILPWPSIFHPPPVVVHLRQGDNEMDQRDGLDSATLTMLSQQDNWMQQLKLNIDVKQQPIFLVTNRVEWYQKFPDWTHPEWSLVHHSALGRIAWGNSNNKDAVRNLPRNREEGLLQMWADWYTLLQAKVIVHTHSDFSLSATRWNSAIQSWTIRGSDTFLKQLNLQRDFEEKRKSTIPRLVDRTPEQLKFCNLQKDSTETKEYKDRKMQQTLALMKARRNQRGGELPHKNNDERLIVSQAKSEQKQSHKPVAFATHVEEKKTATTSEAFLVYHHQSGDGQGVGNVVSGVLAAHLLAEEFNRTVCHYGGYRYESSMGRAFRWKHQAHSEICEKFMEKDQRPNADITIVARNYDRTVLQSECHLKDLLANHEKYPILYYQGNTYPRWPTAAVAASNHRDYFHDYYAPTQTLLDILPWKKSPSTTIHLRQGDGIHDQRQGLDDISLSFLANFSYPTPPFLVTNRVEWYNRFPSSWSHPNWEIVQHSELGPIQDWGGNAQAIFSVGSGNHSLHDDGGGNAKRKALELSKLQMWADWYTLLCTQQQLYHTHSDFSLSAARWNRQIASWTILGSNASGLLLQRDFQVESESDEVVAPLAHRMVGQLKYCEK